MKYIFSILAFLFFQLLFAQKNTHTLGLMGGISITKKQNWSESYIPLTLEYEFRHGKHGFSTGLQSGRYATNWKTNFATVSEFEKYCKEWYATLRSNLSGFSSPFYTCYYSYEQKGLAINLPISYTFYCYSSKKVELFLKGGFLFNFRVQYKTETHFPKTDDKGNFIDPGPFVEIRVNKAFRNNDYQATLGGGIRYKISKKISILGFLQEQYEFYDFPLQYGHAQKLIFHLGSSLKI
jgi:hypothetical protein